MLKKLKILSVSLLLPVVMLFNAYNSVPKDICITQNSDFSLEVGKLCNVSSDNIAVSENGESLFYKDDQGISLNTNSVGRYSLDIKMFNLIPIKTVDVTVSPEYYVIPSGSPVGIKIYAKGLLVVNVSKVKTAEGISVSPAGDAGIETGDRIISANGETLNMSEDLMRIVKESEGNIKLGVMRGDSLMEVSVQPVTDSDMQSKKLGMWVRDSTAGVGTITFFDPSSSTFATLGHGITDIDTGELMLPKSGTVWDCKITYAKKGINGSPGELSGVFGDVCVGDIKLNSQLGVYGKMKDISTLNSLGYMPVATRFQTKTGPGTILADVDGNGVKEYNIEIEEVSKKGGVDNKGLVIRITDPALIEKTGGIVQGMSGSPILQNGKIVGAVTHVFVNDPTRGYGIFIENMLSETEKIK